MLSCRICEATHPLAPLSSCDVCSGPLDVRYVWDGKDLLHRTDTKAAEALRRKEMVPKHG